MANNTQLYEFARSFRGRRLSPLKSIWAYCKYQCCCLDTVSWQECTFKDCLLWKYRLGKGNKKPTARKMSPEHLEKLRIGRERVKMEAKQ